MTKLPQNQDDVKRIKVNLKYLVIPWFVYEDNRLNATQIKLYGFVNSFRGNYFAFSNEHLASMFKVSERAISDAVSKLQEYGYLKADYRIKANGGKIRFITNLKVDMVNSLTPHEENSESDTKNSSSRTRRTPRDNDNKINENKINKDIYSQIFKVWNEQNVITHRSLTDKMKRGINGRLRDGYNKDDVVRAIYNYSTILRDRRCYFKYKWTLQDFLQRGFEKFLDLDTAKSNYTSGDSNKVSRGSGEISSVGKIIKERFGRGR